MKRQQTTSQNFARSAPLQRGGFLRSLAVVLALSCATAFSQPPSPPSSESDLDFFERRIRPLLLERCESCHSENRGKQSGGLAWDTAQGWQKGGQRGSPIDRDRPEESLLLRAVRRLDDDLKMPPEGKGTKLTETEVQWLLEWIRRGAPDPRVPSQIPASSFPSSSASTPAPEWWAFQPVRAGALPPVRDAAWPRADIDFFLLAEMEKRNLRPAPPSDKRTWLRRVTLNVTGLPPQPEEIARFLNDSSPSAFEKVVDRLLASPAYGQRWARFWLDVVRYADYHDANPAARVASCETTEAWRYRDWVVEALNRDLPFNQFIIHQIAGDLLPSPDGLDFYADGLVATTFLSNGVWDRGDADKEKIVSDMVDDQIDTIGKAFLGLTVGCARCHDHKFDPITQEDYYALAGIFHSTRILKELGTKGGEYTLLRTPLAPAKTVEEWRRRETQLATVTARLAELDKRQPPAGPADPERQSLLAEKDQLQQSLSPPLPLAMAAREGGTPGGLFPGIQDVPIHLRGSYARLGAVVPRRMPQFLPLPRAQPIQQGSGRLELARWIASPDHPLTARVLVNRVWQHHFGAGLVRTPGNFGKLGELPSHPALLDWLAARFVEEGWSLKRLHRRILLSAAFQQSSRSTPEALAQDPENRWLARFTRRRLEAEAIRDSVLLMAGRLDPSLGGRAADAIGARRRSLYVRAARWDRASFAILFDAANPDASVDTRSATTVSTQSLFLLNHPFMRRHAGDFARRLLSIPAGAANRIETAYLLLFARPPEPLELEAGVRFLSQAGGVGEIETWTDYAHLLLCANEFVYVD